MLARFGLFALLLLSLFILPILPGCRTAACCDHDDRAEIGQDLLLRGYSVFGKKKDAIEVRMHLFGRDTLPRPKGTELWLQSIEIHGKAGKVSPEELRGPDTLLATVIPEQLGLNWDAPMSAFAADKMKIDTNSTKYSLLARFHYFSIQKTRIGMFDVERIGLFESIHTSEKYNLLVAGYGDGDSISKLAASGTFHVDLGGQAIFDVEELVYTGNAGRIEVFSAPNDGSNLYTTGNRIYYEISPPNPSPWHAYGLVDGRYVDENSWRLGVRVTVGGVPSTKSGVFTGIVPGTIEPLP